MRNLSSLLRPKSLEEFIGQQHIIGANAPLYKNLSNPPHCIFYGPPGCGKTTLAQLICTDLKREIGYFNGATFKLEELKSFVAHYEDSLLKAAVFIDEIHRLNKPQQEFLLPIMEKGEIIVFAASTHNPFYALTNAFRSRAFAFEFKPLNTRDLECILDRALSLYPKPLSFECRDYLIESSAGDARALLNLLDCVLDLDTITLDSLKALRPCALHDGVSHPDTHYNLISALIKSIRGSDVNAALYYLARLIEAGESAEFIARRLVILSSEDIGNANPNALNLATSTLLSVSKIGYPESRIILAQCVIFLSACPKSNTAYKAINKALEFVRHAKDLPIPPNILPHAKDYLYPHDFGGYVTQQYLAQNLEFFEPTQKGFEKTLSQWLDKITQEGAN